MAVYAAQIEKGCMEGTRVRILRDIDAWIKDLTGPQIFWLAGMAGTGKSAIAYTICVRAHNDPGIILGGSFFCSRSTGVAAQRDVRCVIPTLAQLMARQSDMFSRALDAELTVDPDVLHQQVDVQVEKLLYKPLLALKDSKIPIVFVIDALDECSGQLSGSGALDDAETHRIVSDMLEALVAFSRSTVRLPVKFLVTSRPETHIRDTHVSDVVFSKILRLHTVDKQQIDADIRLYISDRLFSTSTLCALFTENDVNTLVAVSDGLFIVAATALKYTLGDGIDLATARFKSLLASTGDKLSIGATERLDQMYAIIVENAAKASDVHTDKLKNLLRIIAALLSARMTLSVTALADLLKIPSGQLRASMTRLHAVFHVPEDDNDTSLRPIHASFGDYLLGRASSHLRIPASLGHEALAFGSLHVMDTSLHFNVSQSRSSFEGNVVPKPTSIRLSLEYACLQWIYHIAGFLETATSDSSISRIFRSQIRSWFNRVPRQQSELDDKINKIFRPRLLFWLEIMSILGQVHRAAAMLMFAATTVRCLPMWALLAAHLSVQVRMKELTQFLRDANSFVASSHQAIARSAPHIYISALPFADNHSLVYQEFAPKYTGLISVNVIGIPHHAGKLVMTLTGHEGPVHSAAYSPDGRLLASGSADDTVRIWDMRTGDEAMAALRSSDGTVWAVAFAPNGKNLVSGTDGGVVCVWNLVAAHVAVQQLRGHTGPVFSVSFAPDGLKIASGSRDATVRLWDVETNQQLVVLSGHSDVVRAIAYSPNGRLLASGSDDRTIQFWNALTGKQKKQSPHRHKSTINGVSFLPDGGKIAAASGHDIILCNTRSEQESATVYRGSESILSVSPSRDGQFLASAHGNSVCVTTLPRFASKVSSIALEGHAASVRAVTFSPDGLYIASASDDRTVRVWRNGGKAEALPPPADSKTVQQEISSQTMLDKRELTGHQSRVWSVAVSPDGASIVSGSNNKSIRVWDLETDKEKLSPLLGHTGTVYSVAISSDGRFIASGSTDNSVRLWDLKTGAAVGQPMQGHTISVYAVVFSPDSRWLASGSYDKTVRVWDVAMQRSANWGPLVCRDSVYSVAVSPNGQLVAAGDTSGRIGIWHSETGQPACEPLDTSTKLWVSISFSPDGRNIAAGGFSIGSNENFVQTWNISTGKKVLDLSGHTDGVRSVAYSSNGRFIATGSKDSTVRLWDAETGAPIATLTGPSDSVCSVTFTPNDRYIVSGSGDNKIYIWTLSQLHSSLLKDIVDAAKTATSFDGWLKGPSGELLLWVPSQYHQFMFGLQNPARCIDIAIGEVGYHRGESWTSCTF